MISAIIIVPKMNDSLRENLKTYNDTFLFDPSGKYLILETVQNVLDTDVNECLLMLNDNYNEIISEKILEEVRDNRLKIIKLQKGVKIIELLLNGLKLSKADYCLCVNGYQPLLSSDTLTNLIKKAHVNQKQNTISILERKKNIFKTSNRVEMPFICKTTFLKKFLENKKSLDLKNDEMKNGVVIRKIQPIKKSELITINSCKDFKKYLTFMNGNYYKTSKLNSILTFFSWNKVSKNFKLYFSFFIALITIILLFMFLYPSNLFFTSANSIESMIGTMVESEAAIIAIVVTLSLVTIQLTASSYSSRVIDIFKNSLSLWILVISYLITMIYGLILLKFLNINSINETLVWIALFLSMFTFFALIPFLLDMLDLMKSSNVINHLEHEIKDYEMLYSIKMDNEDKIQPIIDIIHASLMKYDYGTLRMGLKSITQYNERIYTNKTTFDSEKREISNCILEHLSRVAKLAINQEDDDAASQILIAIGSNARYSKERKFHKEMYDAIYTIGDISEIAAKKNLKFTTMMALVILQPLGNGKLPKLIIDSISKIYDTIEENTTDKNILKGIWAYKVALDVADETET